MIMNQNSSSRGHSQATQPERNVRTVDGISISDWIAPMIAWVALIAVALAIAGFLLGEQ
jgi:hypothetical protein